MFKSPPSTPSTPFPSTRKKKREKEREGIKTKKGGTCRGADHNMKKKQQLEFSLFTGGGFPFPPHFSFVFVKLFFLLFRI